MCGIYLVYARLRLPAARSGLSALHNTPLSTSNHIFPFALDGVWVVKRNEQQRVVARVQECGDLFVLRCSCNIPYFKGLPCRHLMAVNSHCDRDPILPEQSHFRWTVAFFTGRLHSITRYGNSDVLVSLPKTNCIIMQLTLTQHSHAPSHRHYNDHTVPEVQLDYGSTVSSYESEYVNNTKRGERMGHTLGCVSVYVRVCHVCV